MNILFKNDMIKFRLMKIVIVIFLFVITGVSFSQEIGSPIIKNYTPKEYDFHNQNWSIIKDNRGLIYIANGNGILEFDGTEWSKIYVENDYRVRSMAIDSNNVIYVGASGSFGYLAPDSIGDMQYNSISSQCDSSLIKNFANIWRTRVVNNEVYFNGIEALYKYSPYKNCKDINDKISVIYPESRFYLSYVVDNEFLIQDAFEGVLSFFNDSLKQVAGLKNVGGIIYGMIPDFKEDNPDEILIAIKNKLLSYNPNADTLNGELILSNFQTEADSFFKENLIYDVIKVSNGNLAVATLSKGVIIINSNGKIVEYINAQNGLQDETVITMAYYNNLLWLGLNNGISLVELKSPFRIWDKKNEIKGNIQTISRFNNQLFIYTTEGVYYYDEKNHNKTDGSIAKFRKVDGDFREAWCYLNYYDKELNDTILLVGQNKLTELGRDNKVKFISDDLVFCLTQSEINPYIVYGGKQKSFVILKRDRESNSWDIKEIEGVSGLISSITEYENELWFSTLFNGVYVIKLDSSKNIFNATQNDYEIEHFDKSNGLKGVSRIKAYVIDNELVFATPDGLFSFDREKNIFIPNDKLGDLYCSGSSINQIVENENGDLWIDNRGIFYKQSDGKYLFDTTFLKRAPMSLKGVFGDNNIWFGGGADGLMKYNKKNNYDYNKKYNTIIRQVLLNNDSIIFNGTNYIGNDSSTISFSTLNQPNNLEPIIDYDCNNITFKYSSLYFVSQESTLYSYKLEGFDDEWSQWSSETKKEYSYLGEGEYCFLVKSKNIFDTESEIASYKFEILPPFYRTWWAYSLYVILLVILIWLIVKLNTKRHIEAKKQLEKIVQERTLEILLQKEEIESVAKKLKQSNDTKDKLFSIIAHDLKNPFNVIFGYSDLLKRNFDFFGDTEKKQFINSIDESSRRAFKLLENLLLWALSQQQKIEMKIENIYMKTLISEAIMPYLHSAENKNISFSNLVPDDLVINADKQTIKTVLGNLFNNAVKFTNKEGSISISAVLDGKYVRIEVKDNGVGISPNSVNKIFKMDKSHSTLGTNNEKGTGLGLTLCKEFVEKNGGKIWVESTEGEGSTFLFTVPN